MPCCTRCGCPERGRDAGTHINRARAHFGSDTKGMLEGGRHALVHTRSLEFDELRPYVPGDDVRDIDWSASARSASVLIKRFVSEKHHKVLLVADVELCSGSIERSTAHRVKRTFLRASEHTAAQAAGGRGCDLSDQPPAQRIDRKDHSESFSWVAPAAVLSMARHRGPTGLLSVSAGQTGVVGLAGLESRTSSLLLTCTPG